MSNKSQLQTNNTTLDSLITRVNTAKDAAASLPEAGGGGTDTSDATADKSPITIGGSQVVGYSSSDILEGKTAYVDGDKVTGTIPTMTNSSVSVSGATVAVPAGYYPTRVTKSVTSGSATTPATTVTKTPTISVNSTGLITASVSGTQSVTPTVSAGYVSSGTAGTITVSGSATKQLTTQSGTTITPGTSTKTAVASGRYTTGTVYIAGDSDLVASNIKSGVTIFNVTGTYTGGAATKNYTFTTGDGSDIEVIYSYPETVGTAGGSNYFPGNAYISSGTVITAVPGTMVYIYVDSDFGLNTLTSPTDLEVVYKLDKYTGIYILK